MGRNTFNFVPTKPPRQRLFEDKYVWPPDAIVAERRIGRDIIQRITVSMPDIHLLSDKTSLVPFGKNPEKPTASYTVIETIMRKIVDRLYDNGLADDLPKGITNTCTFG